jgi:hypothetical protein
VSDFPPAPTERRKSRCPSRVAPVAPSPGEEPKFSVAEALAQVGTTGVVEVYVDWARQPVRVNGRARNGFNHSWETVGAVLRVRVACAIQPLIASGWRIEGTLLAAMRWDTSWAYEDQSYDGCWVRLRAPIA